MNRAVLNSNELGICYAKVLLVLRICLELFNSLKSPAKLWLLHSPFDKTSLETSNSLF